MYKLTTKNYKMLPEIQKRKDEEKKREELRSRLEKVKQLDQVINFYETTAHDYFIIENKRYEVSTSVLMAL